MATETKEARNRVQGMEVPGWVTSYHKWEAMPGAIFIFILSSLVIMIFSMVIISMKFPAMTKSTSGFVWISVFLPGFTVGMIATLIYVWYETSKRKAARAYAKAELIAILGIKQDHYCEVTVKLGLTHLAHAIQSAIKYSCDTDLLLGAFAKSRALGRLEFDFPAKPQEVSRGIDSLDRNWLANTNPLDSLDDVLSLDKRWIRMARALKRNTIMPEDPHQKV